MIGYWCKATRGTDFILSEQARRNFKLALMSMANYTDLRDWGLASPAATPSARTAASPTPTSTPSATSRHWAT